MNERIKQLRKALALTQQEFAGKLGTSRSNIASYEVGKNIPSEAMIALICKEFDVSEEWLRDGTGEMFVPQSTFSLDEFVRKHGASELELDILKAYFDLDADLRRLLVQHFKDRLMPQDDPLFEIPDSPDELERQFPPVEDDEKNKIG